MTALSVFAADPARLALVHGERRWSYGELADRVARACGALSGEERVAVVADNSVDTVITLHALLALGVPAVLVHPRLVARERAELLAAARPSRVVEGAAPEGPPLRPPPPPDDERPAAILFTSGTTGAPKGAILSRRAFVAAAAASAANLGWREDDRWQALLPLAHVGGLSILTRCLLASRAVVLGEGDATILSLVPAQLARRLDAGWRPAPEVRAILLGGAAAPPALLRRAAEARLPVYVTYGCTEACSQIATQPYGSPEPRLVPVAGMEVRVIDDRVQIRGPSLFSGYLDQPSPFCPGGWYDTGDLGRLAADGSLELLGRRADLIVTGGENVYPAEVERVLAELPGVRDVAVFGVPDPTWGELVAAAFVPAPPPDLDARLATLLAPHKRPRLAYAVPELRGAKR